MFADRLRSILFDHYGVKHPLSFFECGQFAGTVTCRGCDDTTRAVKHCSKKWCPLCQHRIIRKRADELREWVKIIPQPKLVTVTARNTEKISRTYLRKFNVALWKLRRQKVFSLVRGGVQSIEVTNEGRGWHAHAHLVVDARWIDQRDLSIAWGKLVGQDFAIVDVRDKRDLNAAQQAAKYVCKPGQMVKWPAHEIAAFIESISGVRLFNAFGSMAKQRPAIRAALEISRAPRVCDCGCEDFLFASPHLTATEKIERTIERYESHAQRELNGAT